MKTKRIGAIAVAALLVVALGLVAGISMAQLGSSSFEIEDGNTTVDDPGNYIDWDALTTDDVPIAEDEPTGSADDSFGQGTKEDTEVPTVTDGSIPPNKSDLLEFGVYQEGTGGEGYLHLFWTRVQDPSGTTLMDFEINKNKCEGEWNGAGDVFTPTVDSDCSDNDVTPLRSTGDLLITYELAKGGKVPDLYLYKWQNEGDDPPLVGDPPGSEIFECEAEKAPPCWGGKFDLSDALVAAGSINTDTITSTLLTDPPGPPWRSLDPRTFGEASVDLSVIFDPGVCDSFGSAYLKSRSSDSFTAALKDFIAPVPINLGNCGTVIVRKFTDPSGSLQEFGFSLDGTTSAPPPDDVVSYSFALSDTREYKNEEIIQGSYTITETDANMYGFDLVDVTCKKNDGPEYSVPDYEPEFDIGIGDTVVCSYTNQARGTIIVDKITDPAEDPQLFDFDLYDSDGVLDSFKLADLTTPYDSQDLPPGSYAVTETVPSGWDLELSYCETTPGAADIEPDDITLAAGETVYCYFENTKLFTIIVLACQQSGPSLYPSEVTFGTDVPVASLGVDNLRDNLPPELDGISDEVLMQFLCGLGGARFEDLTDSGSTYEIDVTIYPYHWSPLSPM
jgi:hypothetical protein